MSEKYILIVMFMVLILFGYFGKGSFFKEIREITHRKYAFFVAWILDKYARFSRTVSAEKSLRYAILSGNEERMMHIISQKENWNFLADRLLQDEHGNPCTVLMFAIKNRQEKIALKLLSYWCNINTLDNKGHTPLYYARKFDMKFVIRELKKRKAHER